MLKLDRRLLFWLVALAISSLALVGVANAQELVATTTPTPDAAAIGIADAATNAAQTIGGTAQALWDQLSQTPQSDLARVLLIIGGVILLIAGWFVYEWIILIAGFLIGATVALSLFPQSDALLSLLVFLVGGLIGTALAGLVYYVAVFLIGGYIGIVITQGLAVALNLTPVSLAAILVGFVIGGVILILLSLELLIVFSAIVGAQMIALALNLSVAWMILLALVGIVLQLAAIRTRGVNIRRRPVRRTIWARRRAVID